MTHGLEKAGCYNAALSDRREASALGRIRVLDDHLINRIAAGEVVERPASVVKELVENALDAGATAHRGRRSRTAGGKHAIRVADDGCGHGPRRRAARPRAPRHEQARGASSDLERSRTLGFRGEALPSIAAVAGVCCAPRPRTARGTEVEVRGGRIAAVRALARPRGTTGRRRQPLLQRSRAPQVPALRDHRARARGALHDPLRARPPRGARFAWSTADRDAPRGPGGRGPSARAWRA